MCFLLIELALNSSCRMRIGCLADDLAGISDYMAGIDFMKLFENPADKFLVNY